MILQALNRYYQRLLADPERDVPEPGFADAKVSFALVLDQGGGLVDVHDLRNKVGTKLVGAFIRVTMPAIRSGKKTAPNFLWDKTDYALGATKAGVTKRSRETFEAFRKQAHELSDQLNDAGMQALLKFLDSWEPENAQSKIEAFLPWKEVAGAFLVFRLDGKRSYIHQSESVRAAWKSHYHNYVTGFEGQCLVTGQDEVLLPTHPKIKGVWRANDSGATLVSFNDEAYESFGKTQNYNSPIGKHAAFAYTTALNWLLVDDSPQKVQIGDASCVFWSEAKSELEEILGQMLEPSVGGNNQQNQRLAAFFDAYQKGLLFEFGNPESPFYVLGLSPNKARLAVRFWLVSTVETMARRLAQHLADVEIVRRKDEPEYLSTKQITKTLARPPKKGETPKIPPRLGGEMARALFSGEAYPKSILSAAVARIRADGFVNRSRAALIKAYLNRALRKNPAKAALYQSMEVPVSLDQESKNVPYRLGRLFAVLEDLQKSALGRNLNVTIRDRYMSSASSAPAATFPQLLRLAQAHIKKSDYGNKYQKDLAEVMEALPSSGFPASLKLEEQGLFFLGYYHQVKQIMDDIESAKAKKDQNAAGEALED